MAETTSVIDNLKDKSNNILYPRTLVKAVYDDNGNRLDNLLKRDEYYLEGTTVLSSFCWEKIVKVSRSSNTAPFSWEVAVEGRTIGGDPDSPYVSEQTVTLSSEDSVVASLYIPTNSTASAVKTFKKCWSCVDVIEINNGSITVKGYSSVPSQDFYVHLLIHKHGIRNLIYPSE